MDPKAANVLVETLGSTLAHGGAALSEVPELLKRTLREKAWQRFVTQRGELVEHASFAEFVTTPPLHGLGTDVDLIRRVVADETEALDLLDQALKNPHGIHDVNNINVTRPQGTSQDAALRKLRKDRPDLHERVLAGELSSHAAMVEAGFRHRTQTVRIDDPEAIARTLTKHMTPEALERLKELLCPG